MASTRLRLLGGFDLRAGEGIVTLPFNVRRLIALLAVRGRPQDRATVSGTLWMDTTHRRAHANLRSTLWKLGTHRDLIVSSSVDQMWLAPHVDVDITRVLAQAKRLIRPVQSPLVDAVDVDDLCAELLPDWDEEWLHDERERFRQLRMHALETLCRSLASRGRNAEAIDAGHAAVAADPLRESAQCALITAHLAEGNVSEARRQFELYRSLLWDHLGVSPSPLLTRLLPAVASVPG
jgi:DNA-binding SARP family transcriptional activator